MWSVMDILASENLLLGPGCLSVHKDRAVVADAGAAPVVWEGTKVHRGVEAGRRSVLVEKTVEPDSSTRVRCSTVHSSRRSRTVPVTRKTTMVVVEQDLPTPGQRGSDLDGEHPKGDQRCFQRPRCEAGRGGAERREGEGSGAEKRVGEGEGLMMGKDAPQGRESRENWCPWGPEGVHRRMEKTHEKEKDERGVFGGVERKVEIDHLVVWWWWWWWCRAESRWRGRWATGNGAVCGTVAHTRLTSFLSSLLFVSRPRQKINRGMRGVASAGGHHNSRLARAARRRLPCRCRKDVRLGKGKATEKCGGASDQEPQS
jgi:hypothetical protein